MKTNEPVRIDKFLWAVRLFKTRSLAAEACEKNRVTINGSPLKASRMIKPGDTFELRQPPITRSFRVKQTSGNRMGAKLVPDFLEDVTTPEQLQLLEMAKMAQSLNRPKGLGRPTKKERRDLDDLFESDWDEEEEHDS
ncbi:ribosome-associated heat shock protein Hsp15 [Breznakibacter xylanolyticus]|uniref:Ribosome-associated heat shock protein Hsp15 n=1 Tax=Breznakibacter xylanolyticus TaxID=990 RepID=A0A2W7Q6G5_9BACT|nr:RNA-binding S4 domain-containing protein [Breznakibacter xylanolyticus]MBN2743553.1 RNA-binding S4 domain-containing protein [Marinilabiliaceae bacterium]PZX17339.1 ribosome-associated heat shock protein Hsp15 [Breznakibacter xylanolyticus]